MDWDYKGIFPNNAVTSGNFWGFRGIKSYSGNPNPSGTLSATETEVITPGGTLITCTAINTHAYAWQYSSDKSSWTDIKNEYTNQISKSYNLGEHGDTYFRCICYGWLGKQYTAPIKISVIEPSISIYLTTDKSTMFVGESATISAFIIPYPAYAKSYKWQKSSDEETWIDIPEETSQTLTFIGTEAGTTYFRMVGTQYDDVTVISHNIIIEVTEEIDPEEE